MHRILSTISFEHYLFTKDYFFDAKLKCLIQTLAGQTIVFLIYLTCLFSYSYINWVILIKVEIVSNYTS